MKGEEADGLMTPGADTGRELVSITAGVMGRKVRDASTLLSAAREVGTWLTALLVVDDVVV